jgi:hypothetical protein
VVDGNFCDGGDARTVGWARYSTELKSLPTSGVIRIAPTLHGDLGGVRIYSTHLRTSEAVANWRAGRE